MLADALDGNAEKNGTTDVAKAYLQNLYADDAQKLIARHYFRPAHADKADPADMARFAKLETGTAFGGHSEVGVPIDDLLKRPLSK